MVYSNLHNWHLTKGLFTRRGQDVEKPVDSVAATAHYYHPGLRGAEGSSMKGAGSWNPIRESWRRGCLEKIREFSGETSPRQPNLTLLPLSHQCSLLVKPNWKTKGKGTHDMLPIKLDFLGWNKMGERWRVNLQGQSIWYIQPVWTKPENFSEGPKNSTTTTTNTEEAVFLERKSQYFNCQFFLNCSVKSK